WDPGNINVDVDPPAVWIPVMSTLLAICVGLVAFALNIPFFIRTFRERKRLKELGLSSLTRSLWKESRRSRWISRIRGAVLLVVIGLLVISNILTAIQAFFFRSDLNLVVMQLIGLIIGVTLFAGTRYLQIQRERM